MLRLRLGTLLRELTLLVEGFGLRDGRHNIVILEVLGVVLPYTLLFQLAKSMINFVGLSMCNVWWYHRSRLGQGSSSRVNRGHNVGRGAPVD